ncbi:MAG: hypothetical protein ACJ74D_02030 [Gaiellaceae bacterium]
MRETVRRDPRAVHALSICAGLVLFTGCDSPAQKSQAPPPSKAAGPQTASPPRPAKRPRLAAPYRGPGTIVFRSDRDGDDDFYAASEDGQHVFALTKNKADDTNGDSPLVVSTAYGRISFIRDDSDVILLDAQSGTERRLGSGEPVEISSNGAWIAFYSENPWSGDASASVVSTAGGRVRRLGPGEPVSFSPDGSLLLIASDSLEKVAVVPLAGGPLRAVAPESAETLSNTGVVWSPTSRKLAYLDAVPNEGPTRLRVVDAVAKVPRPRVMAPRISSGALLTWLSDTRIGYESGPKIAAVDLDARPERVLALGARTDYWSPEWHSALWSPDGARVAYARGAGDLVIAPTAGGGRVNVRLHLGGLAAGAWSPSGRYFAASVEQAVGRARDLYIVDATTGHSRILVRDLDFVDSILWAPDERALALQTSPRGATAIAVVSIGSGRMRKLIEEGNNQLLAWIRTPGTRRPGIVRHFPAPEIGTRSRLRATGKVREIAADRDWVAGIFGTSRLDCHHVSSWQPATATVVRFAVPRRCEYASGVELLVGLSQRGKTTGWDTFSCGMSCYLVHSAGDVRRPGHTRRSTGDSESGYVGDNGTKPPVPPRPPHEVRRGVRVSVRAGSVILTRLADGKIRSLHPPGGAVDAELENTGLFYAYNVGGKYPGRVVFVPFAQLFR